MFDRICRFAVSSAVMAAALWPQIAAACPTCKDSLTENYIAAYGWSIMFMMSMPFLIFGSLVAYFYYEVRKARRQQESAEEGARPAEREAPASDVLGTAGVWPSR